MTSVPHTETLGLSFLIRYYVIISKDMIDTVLRVRCYNCFLGISFFSEVLEKYNEAHNAEGI